MAAQRKPRGDSWLKTRPEELQDGTIAAVAGWLQSEFDRAVSPSSLSGFFSWWHLRERLRSAERQSVSLEELLRKRQTGLTEQAILDIGNTFFLEQGLAQGDAKVFAAIQDRVLSKRIGETKAKQKDRELALSERRVALLEAKAAKADAAIETANDPDFKKGTSREAQNKLREALGMEPLEESKA